MGAGLRALLRTQIEPGPDRAPVILLDVTEQMGLACEAFATSQRAEAGSFARVAQQVAFEIAAVRKALAALLVRAGKDFLAAVSAQVEFEVMSVLESFVAAFMPAEKRTGRAVVRILPCDVAAPVPHHGAAGSKPLLTALV